MSSPVKPATQSKASNQSANSAWFKGPPQTTAASNSPHAQSPAGNAPPGTHSRRQSTLGPNARQGAVNRPVIIGCSVTGAGHRPSKCGVHGVQIGVDNITILAANRISFGSIDAIPVPAPVLASAPATPTEEAKQPDPVPAAPPPSIATPQPPASAPAPNPKKSLNVHALFQAGRSTPVIPHPPLADTQSGSDQQHYPQHAPHIQPQWGQQPYYYPPQGFDPYMHYYWPQQYHPHSPPPPPPHQHPYMPLHMHNPLVQPSPRLPSPQPRPTSAPPVPTTSHRPPAPGYTPPPISTDVHNPAASNVSSPIANNQTNTAATSVSGSPTIRPRASIRVGTPDESVASFGDTVPPSPKVSVGMGQSGELPVSLSDRQSAAAGMASSDNAQLTKEKKKKKKGGNKAQEEREKNEEKERLEQEAEGNEKEREKKERKERERETKERAEREERERIEREAREKEKQERKEREEKERLEREERERTEREKAEAEANANAEVEARLRAEAGEKATAETKFKVKEEAEAAARAKAAAEVKAEASNTVSLVESSKPTPKGLLQSTTPGRPSSLSILTTASEHPKRPVPGPLDLNSDQGKPRAAPPSVLASARVIEVLNAVSYPEAIKAPNPDLNVAAMPGKFRYDREFLLQFMDVCKERPDSLPPLDAIGLEPCAQGTSGYPGGARQGGRRVGPIDLSGAPGIQHQRSIGLGLGSILIPKKGFSMGSFQAPPTRHSQPRFEASTAAGRGGAGVPSLHGATNRLTPMIHNAAATAKEANNTIQHSILDQAADGVDVVGPTAAAISEDAVAQKAEECIKACLSTENVGQAINILQRLPDSYRAMLIEKSISAAFDGGSKSVAAIARLFAAAHAQRICTPKLFERGFLPSVESADDTSMDSPRTYEWLAGLLHAAGLTKARVERMAEGIV
ncbi:hypothetical protein FRC10_000406, partial [Ceratobasidium sp. 414]